MRGIERFREAFADFEEQYVLIGGAACSLLFEEAGGTFRATKDLDIVLIVEALSEAFARRFWSFVREGGYQINRRSDGVPRYYRFEKPSNTAYPAMLELFTRRAVDWIDQKSTLEPLPLGDDISSLSAIILNDAYYRMVREGARLVEGVRVLGPEYLIPLKAKAWLDLSREQAEGVRHIDSKNISKHKKDVARLAILLTEDRPELPEEVREDMRQFLSEYIREPVRPKDLGIRGINAEEIEVRLRRVYGLGEVIKE